LRLRRQVIKYTSSYHCLTHTWGLRLKTLFGPSSGASPFARGLHPSAHARGLRPSAHARGLRPSTHARGLRPSTHARGLRLSLGGSAL
jgi:hypothetical protein